MLFVPIRDAIKQTKTFRVVFRFLDLTASHAFLVKLKIAQAKLILSKLFKV